VLTSVEIAGHAFISQKSLTDAEGVQTASFAIFVR
jgi:hypothetical protein